MAKKRVKVNIFSALQAMQACSPRIRRYRGFTSPLRAWQRASFDDKKWCLRQIKRDVFIDVDGRRRERCWCCSEKRMKKMYPRPPRDLINYFRRMAKGGRA